MKLTEHFTSEELTTSQTAIRRGLDNVPDIKEIENLKLLCSEVLEPIRIEIKVPIIIKSGYRSPQINMLIGGAVNSQHIDGKAADTIAVGLDVNDYYNIIKIMVRKGQIEVDQCILEFNSWVHISFNKKHNRNQFLIATKMYGLTNYKQDKIN